MVTRSILLSQLLILVMFGQSMAQSSIPFIYNAGTGNCPPGASQFDRSEYLEIANTTYDSLYRTECYASGDNTFILEMDGLYPGEMYSLYLHFAEIFYGPDNTGKGGVGSRVFDMYVNGDKILANLDIYEQVGSNTALVYRYDAMARLDSTIELRFVGINNNPKISALEVVNQGIPSLFPSESGIVNLTGSLPVEWTSFDAQVQNDGSVMLQWSTAVELNNLGYEVEMRKTNESFEKAGFVQAGSINGDSYQFRTNRLDAGRYQFRLAQVDFDGTINYSSLVETLIGANAWTGNISRNGNLATLSLLGQPESNITATIVSLNGQTWGTQNLNAGAAWSLSLDQFPAGLYLIRLTDGQFVQTIKLPIQR